MLVDIQDFYFPGGAMELVNANEAGLIASNVLQLFRENKLLVIHIKHKAKKGAAINEVVRPFPNELVLTKTEVNAFKGTQLKAQLDKHGIKRLVIVGMQTHMCLEAAARASADFGYKVTVVEDACATRDLKYNDVLIPSAQVHASTLNTLQSYASVISFEVFKEKFFN